MCDALAKDIAQHCVAEECTSPHPDCEEHCQASAEGAFQQSSVVILQNNNEAFRELGRRASALAPRVAAVLEGGYNLRTLPRLVEAALEGFSD